MICFFLLALYDSVFWLLIVYHMFRYQSLWVYLIWSLFSFLNVLIHVFLQIWNAFGFISPSIFFLPPSLFSLLLRFSLSIFSAILDNVTGVSRWSIFLLLYFYLCSLYWLLSISLSLSLLILLPAQYTVVGLLVNFSCQLLDYSASEF